MYCAFSEMQFVFGILHELVNCWTPGRGWSAPTLPTQRQEANLGYDTMIKGPVRTLYFQFKVPEKITTSRGKYWSDFGGPYYRFDIWPNDRSHQHNSLVDLAKKDLRNKVYYCSPAFHTEKEFSEHYRNKRIAQKSIYVDCGTLQTIADGERHDICYTLEPLKQSVMHSEEYPIKALELEGLRESAKSAESYEDIHECLRMVGEKFAIDTGDAESTMERFERISNQLLMKQNLNLVLLGE